MEIKSKIQEKREFLKELSNDFKNLKKYGTIRTINEGLRRLYAQ
jgi:uncharacterized protein (DUF2225 family)